MGIQIEMAVTDGIEMQYFRFGEGKRKMVMLPGLSVKSIMIYKDAIADGYSQFAKDYEVYVFEKKKNPPKGYSISEMADDLIKVLDLLNLKDTYVYSVSQGGMIAQYVAIRRPDLVKALCLGSTTARLTKESREIILEWNRLANEKDENGLILSFSERVYSEKFFARFRDMIVESSKGITDEEFERLANITDKIGDFDASGELGKIKCPVLVLSGSDDRIFGEESVNEFAEKLNCEPKVYEGFGHAVYDENPVFRKDAKAFFDKN